jgi:hypothetical protein
MGKKRHMNSKKCYIGKIKRNYCLTGWMHINKQHEFWQRDPLAILLYSREVAFQKLDYIPARPVRRALSGRGFVSSA